MTFQLPAVPACRILAKADIPHDDQIRYGFFDGTNGTLHGARHIPGGGSLVIFVFRQAKDLYRRDTELVYFFCHLDRIVNGEMVLPRHTRDFLLHIRARYDKDRVDEIIQFQRVFSDHAANGSRSS